MDQEDSRIENQEDSRIENQEDSRIENHQEILKFRQLIEHYEESIDNLLDNLVKEIGDFDWLKYLINISKDEASQRTAEWYKQRNACITASAIHGILSNSKYKRDKFILEKCGESQYFRSKYTDWGNQYEPVAVNVYEQLRNVKIYDAPLLTHMIYPFIGASSDGFVLDKNNKRGYLIEIKCPYSRIPNGKIPIHYWEQPQIQMEVCKIDKCIFFDCKFREVKEEEIPKESRIEIPKESRIEIPKESRIEIPKEHGKEFWGCMIEVFNKEKNDKEYIYNSKLNGTLQQYQKWIKKNTPDPKNENLIFIRHIFWKLDKFCEVEETRNKKWFKENLIHLRNIWDEIMVYRELGLEKLKKDLNKSEYIPPPCI